MDVPLPELVGPGHDRYVPDLRPSLETKKSWTSLPLEISPISIHAHARFHELSLHVERTFRAVAMIL
ncbi:hypothetical protein JDV02_009324 [Purpureocillium takamizusanense]|uniref:Uncharacterized protein n=1 Tax=Purpureocillium takamizusanense TaxID=2060973 RepID=A0A9Q8VG59_9HYPO|nr:uncharacterized protein JDV02_009324 [Purpureocillium takamizusanense]UNI23507.1 hypothetical protein JDV02_009324 [Purpureocillium takamizusanense]